MTDTLDRPDDLVILGLPLRTSQATAATDIPAHWQRFMQAGIQPVRADDPAIYAVYCDYESDWHGAYTLVLGVAADPSTPIPDGHRRVRIPAGRYARFPANGDPAQVIWQTWQHINTAWAQPRRYLADYERYTARDAAEIFVGV